MKSFLPALLLALLLLSCATKSKIVSRTTENILNSKFYESQFTGFVLFDPETKDTLYNQNGSKYFTPASNTKIFTLYTSLKMLPDSLPSLFYHQASDTTYVQGTGDPTFLHPYFDDLKALEFLRKQNNVKLYLGNLIDERLGPGWSWGDYQYYYQPERSAMPLYGNVTTLQNIQEPKVLPAVFVDSVVRVNAADNRKAEENIFFFDGNRKDTLEVPFRTGPQLTKSILESELNRAIELTDKKTSPSLKTFYGIESDTVYRRMMHNSDNFIAEQLLILASSTLSDTLDSQRARDFMLENFLWDLKQEPRWVDGSGLSRYNLITPESLIQVLHKLYTELPRDRLLSFFPTGGKSGTLKNWYPGIDKPYIYAKTGSLSNNHCLSGFLITKSGKTLIFSFMNNHFRESSSEVKKRMQLILEKVRDTY
ncbi:D-alanyl-D-alanine carboxypeptidase [Euzebyella marina]|uniref:D-alanyl-D-alanine carboxypeptidase n=1 Tax=Euzebyella marina TaxID=1761453 RepID=A0A3G2L647_9FLAO|nr:D-alanyl-D-alanine carboxypeptidase [Euzebyella marina]AYN67735.1 D-alanyl-D-alanine carboxypeptidase [Euzebyella marina]